MDQGAAVWAGLEGACTGALFAGSGVLALHKYHRGFRRGLGASGKAALVVMPAFFLAALRSEQNVHAQQRRNFRKVSNSSSSSAAASAAASPAASAASSDSSSDSSGSSSGSSPPSS